MGFLGLVEKDSRATNSAHQPIQFPIYYILCAHLKHIAIGMTGEFRTGMKSGWRRLLLRSDKVMEAMEAMAVANLARRKK